MQIRRKLYAVAAAIAAAAAIGAAAAPAAQAAPARFPVPKAPAAGHAHAKTGAGHRAHPFITGDLCESSSPNLCVFNSSGSQVTEVNGTSVTWNPNGNTFTFGGVTYNVGTLSEGPNSGNDCLAVNGFNNVVRGDCSTGAGIIWGLGASNGHDVWVNRLHTQNNGTLTVLAASGSVGAVVNVETWPPAPGVFERWGFF